MGCGWTDDELLINYWWERNRGQTRGRIRARRRTREASLPNALSSRTCSQQLSYGRNYSWFLQHTEFLMSLYRHDSSTKMDKYSSSTRLAAACCSLPTGHRPGCRRCLRPKLGDEATGEWFV